VSETVRLYIKTRNAVVRLYIKTRNAVERLYIKTGNDVVRLYFESSDFKRERERKFCPGAAPCE
jgi:hypothetical protein